MNLGFALCAALCVGVALFHEIIGVPALFPPLASANVNREVLGMFYFSWHADVVLVLGMGSLFACAALSPTNRPMGFIATAMSAGLGLLAFGMVLFYDLAMWGTPAPIVWTAMPLIGVAGCLSKPATR